jgi:hypothetical protein
LSTADIEVSSDNLRAKCNICASYNSDPSDNRWIDRGQINRHLGTASHKRCVDAENLRLANRRNIEQITRDDEEADARELGHISPGLIPGISGHRHGQVISSAEEEMWAAYDMEDVTFSAGVEDTRDADERRRIEREMDEFGIWNAGLLGRDLGAPVDDFQLDDLEDEVLEQMMQNARKCLSNYA